MEQFLQALDSTNGWLADYSLPAAILSLMLAFVLGQVLAWIYIYTHSGLSYSRSFTQSLVLMTIIVCLVMFVIGNNLITAFGLLGALALIRFRNVLKDTRDTVFVFMALVTGMAVGTQRYMIAILGMVAMGLVVLYLNATSFGSLGRYDGYLTLRLASAREGMGRGVESIASLLPCNQAGLDPTVRRRGGRRAGLSHRAPRSRQERRAARSIEARGRCEPRVARRARRAFRGLEREWRRVRRFGLRSASARGISGAVYCRSWSGRRSPC